MEFFWDIDEPKEEVKQVSLEDILAIDHDVEEVTDTIGVYDICKSQLYYGCKKEEMLGWLQPHSVDIAIYSIEDDWKKELKAMFDIVGYVSTIYIFDNKSLHTSDVERHMNFHGFQVGGESKMLDYTVIEYKKGKGESMLEYFNPVYDTEIFSILFVNNIEYYTVVYCDVEELIDMIHYAHSNDKNVVFPLPISRIEYVNNYLENKVTQTNKISDGNQFELF